MTVQNSSVQDPARHATNRLSQRRSRRHEATTAGTPTSGSDREDAIRIDVKLDLDLGDTAWCGGDAIQAEIAQRLVVPHKLALACTTAMLT